MVVRRMSSGRAHNEQVRVLVVEDHVALANRIGEGLRDAGFAVDVVYDGAAALESTASTGYDVIVLDRDLPAVHGDRVCRRLVRDGSPSRILMLTAATDVEDRVDGLELGADARDQLVEGERLAEVIIGAQLQPVDPVLDVGGRGEHQDAAERAVTHQPAADPVAVHGRQVTVEHDHVVIGARRALQGCRAVIDHVHGQARVAQTFADPVGQRNVILHDQHPHMHIVRLR